MAIEKEKMAIYAVIGLVIVATVLYCVYEFGGGNSEVSEGEQSSSMAFEAPANNPDHAKREQEKYKSSLDVYEQNHESETEEEETVNLGFNKLTDNEKDQEDVVPVEQKQQVIYRERRPSTNYTVKKNSDVVEKVEPKIEPPLTKKKGLITAADNSANNTAVLTSDVSIPVLFHGDQTLVNGGPAKLRTTKACSINGNIIQAGTVLTGYASFEGDYVFINITSIDINGSPMAVKLTAYKKGQRGIYAPSNTNKDMVKENINSNTSGGVRVSVPGVPISGTINPNLSKKTTEKSSSLFVPSQSTMVLNPIPDNN